MRHLRIFILGLVLSIVAGGVLGFGPLASGRTEQPTAQEAFDDLGKPLLEHPDRTSIEFTESVSERDRRLVTMAVDIARPLFEASGFPLKAELYIAGDKDSYLRLYQKLFTRSVEEALESYVWDRGATNGYYARVLINIPIHDKRAVEKRDADLVFTVVHEFYHILQTRLSGGWDNATDVPIWISEGSANRAAFRAMFAAFCVPLTEINTAVSSFAQTSQCSKEFVNEAMFDYEANYFLSTPASFFTSIKLYIFAEFGIDAYDRFYAALPVAATTFRGNIPAIRTQLWLKALETTFGVSSMKALEDRAIAYIAEHRESIFQRLNKK